jgi:hypothetical protein
MRALPLAVLALCVSCAEHERVSPSTYPSSGLYTPGSTLGASDPTDMPPQRVCASLPPVPGAVDGGAVGTSGTLTIEYMTKTYEGLYAPRHVTAVWIETMNEQYVATLEVQAAVRRKDLAYFQDHACVDQLGPDAITGATLRNHDKMHVLEWTGLDFESKSVPDGDYQLFIEMTETDLEPGELTVFGIVKGPTSYTMPLQVPAEAPLVQVTATWAVR